MARGSAPNLSERGVSSGPADRDAPDQALSGQVLAYVRRRFDDDSLAFRMAPKPIVHGADTRTLEFELVGDAMAGQGFVLRIFPDRVFRTRGAGERARLEAAIQGALVGAGYPAAPVVDVGATGVLDGPFILMERLAGAALLEQLGSLGSQGGFRIPSAMTVVREASTLPFVPHLLAQAQHRLHALDARILVSGLDASGVAEESLTVDAHLRTITETTDNLGLDELGTILGWLRDHRPAEVRRVICHGDIQPLNVLTRRYQVSGVVDWSWTTLAEPELDFGFSNAAFATAPVEGPRHLRGFLERAQRRFSANYLRAARRSGGLDARRIEYYQVLRCALAIGAIARRREGDDEGQLDAVWDTAAGSRALHGYVRSVTRTFAVGVTSAGER
jgi:aminoglycoside phosphotransferase (APT) family kinase protein